MMNILCFLLGVSLAINVFLFLIIVVYVKIRKGIFSNGKKDIEIADINAFRDFMESDKL